MQLKRWEKLPREMQTPEVRKYYDILKKKRVSLFFKRTFDIAVSFLMLVVLSPVFLLLAVLIKLDSPGPVFYRQVRVTAYGKRFRIHKFRTMVNNADRSGSLVTIKNDSRVTRVGRFIRKCRLDEVSQLIDVLVGNMTFVGTRPEVVKYVERYTPAMYATLLLPAGVTSLASIYYKDEAELLQNSVDADETYLKKVLPGKMYYNLKAIERFGFWRDIKIMGMTVMAMFGKKFHGDHSAPTKENPEEFHV